MKLLAGLCLAGLLGLGIPAYPNVRVGTDISFVQRKHGRHWYGARPFIIGCAVVTALSSAQCAYYMAKKHEKES